MTRRETSVPSQEAGAAHVESDLNVRLGPVQDSDSLCEMIGDHSAISEPLWSVEARVRCCGLRERKQASAPPDTPTAVAVKQARRNETVAVMTTMTTTDSCTQGLCFKKFATCACHAPGLAAGPVPLL